MTIQDKINEFVEHAMKLADELRKVELDAIDKYCENIKGANNDIIHTIIKASTMRAAISVLINCYADGTSIEDRVSGTKKIVMSYMDFLDTENFVKERDSHASLDEIDRDLQKLKNM